MKSKSVCREKFTAKACIIGDFGVGKTSIYNRFIRNEFRLNTQPTQLPEYSNKRSFLVEEAVVKMSLWDTTGHDRYEHLNERFIHGTQCFVVVFDLTNIESFIKARKKLKEIDEKFIDKICILVGNKCDIEEGICISEEEALSAAKEYNAEFFEASAKTGHNVHNIFATAINLMKENNLLNRSTSSSPVESPELLKGSSKGSLRGSLRSMGAPRPDFDDDSASCVCGRKKGCNIF